MKKRMLILFMSLFTLCACGSKEARLLEASYVSPPASLEDVYKKTFQATGFNLMEPQKSFTFIFCSPIPNIYRGFNDLDPKTKVDSVSACFDWNYDNVWHKEPGFSFDLNKIANESGIKRAVLAVYGLKGFEKANNIVLRSPRQVTGLLPDYTSVGARLQVESSWLFFDITSYVDKKLREKMEMEMNLFLTLPIAHTNSNNCEFVYIAQKALDPLVQPRLIIEYN
ncbi:MAG: hypothetical protein AB7E47_15580 [Desulfovibrionaceae bacterium]